MLRYMSRGIAASQHYTRMLLCVTYDTYACDETSRNKKHYNKMHVLRYYIRANNMMCTHMWHHAHMHARTHIHTHHGFMDLTYIYTARRHNCYYSLYCSLDIVVIIIENRADACDRRLRMYAKAQAKRS